MLVRVCKNHVREGLDKLGQEYAMISIRKEKYANMKCIFCDNKEEFILSCWEFDDHP